MFSLAIFFDQIRFVFIVSKAVIFWIQSFSCPSTRDPSWLGTFANHPTKRKWPVTLAQMRRMYGLFYLYERWKMAAWTKGNVGTSGIGSSRIISTLKMEFSHYSAWRDLIWAASDHPSRIWIQICYEHQPKLHALSIREIPKITIHMHRVWSQQKMGPFNDPSANMWPLQKYLVGSSLAKRRPLA